MIKVRRYTDADKLMWNDFINKSKNGLFMFDRNYMDYHKDRFVDHSLLFFKDDSLIAIMPSSEHEGKLISHGGLTYGGMISDNRMKQHTMNECFDSLCIYLKDNRLMSVKYKCIPYIYHKYPAEEDRYALYAHGANIVAVDASTFVRLDDLLKMPKGRKAQINRAKREGVTVEILSNRTDYNAFIYLENEVLRSRHGTQAVHTGDELYLLHNRFPGNIHLIAAKIDNRIIAGTIIYEYEKVVHTQYMAANEEARIVGALDLTICKVIEHYGITKQWLDFGISTEHDKIYLNEGLISQKEGFGGRTGVYETWEIRI